ncbi:MAG: THUMP domain-containing protein, partial [Nanoarchaeota archaeon]|nr:THUMP domain-containing protein [Nanoarchaeota archaeon]
MEKFDCVICRYGEIGLKGENRQFFEKQLCKNIRAELIKRKISFRFVRVRGRLLFYTDVKVDFFRNIFGLVSFSYATELLPDISVIKEELKKLKIKEGTKFRVSAKRVEKIIDMNSMEIERELGAFILQNNYVKVDLTKYELEICVEFFNGKAYLFTSRIPALGGLPSGIEGNVYVDIR